MAFQVKATVVACLGDAKKYPCHFQHKVGDEIVYDGEKFVGRICPSMASMLIPQMMAVHAAGPRHIARPGYYYPFWYAPASVDDPLAKKFDGLGYRNVLDAEPDPDDPVQKLVPKGAFQWPPRDVRDVSKAPSVVCPDVRTSVLMKIEAIDLSDKGYDTPFFRRQMTILRKIEENPGMRVADILGAFSKTEIETIYPALSAILVEALVEEIALMGYAEILDGAATITRQGHARLKAFIADLPQDHRQALGL